MSAIVGLDGKAIGNDPVLHEREVAIAELRKLLADMETGQVPVSRWVLSYAVDLGAGNETIELLDSKLTLETTLWMLTATKHKLLNASIGRPL